MVGVFNHAETSTFEKRETADARSAFRREGGSFGTAGGQRAPAVSRERCAEGQGGEAGQGRTAGSSLEPRGVRSAIRRRSRRYRRGQAIRQRSRSGCCRGRRGAP